MAGSSGLTDSLLVEEAVAPAVPGVEAVAGGVGGLVEAGAGNGVAGEAGAQPRVSRRVAVAATPPVTAMTRFTRSRRLSVPSR